MRAALARAARAHGGRPLRLGLVAAIVTALLVSGTGAYAYWTTSAGVTGTAKSATLVVTASNFGAIGFSNDKIPTVGSTDLVVSSTVQVTNTTVTASSQTMNLDLVFTATGDSTLPGATSLSVWKSTAAAPCSTTVPSTDVTNGTWAGLTAQTGALAKNETGTYCLVSRVPRATIATAAGGRSMTPSVVATLKVGGFTTAATALQSSVSSQRVYPAATLDTTRWMKVVVQSNSYCLDVSGSGTASGTSVINWFDCHGASNQQWRFTPDATGAGYYEITPRNAPALRVDQGSSLTVGGPVSVTTDNGSIGQIWQAQTLPSGRVQFVSKASGLCLEATSANTTMTQQKCSGADNQAFSVSGLTPISFPVTCTPAGTNTAQTATWSWTAANGYGPFTLQASRNGTVLATSTAGSGAGSISIDTSAALYNGLNNILITDATGATVWSGGVTMQTSTFLFWTTRTFSGCS
ncbi:RICIN domain-containing protein [Schumannella soli]|uniref:Ricin B lectin domain-containing protein n=1 Tax=Schumannella soli TaxID=2590779 RepID=A0A506XS49_9MICO|nr:RICIN domain-containing protein [Schumannella soli]TPW75461.1 hypothetical protein FJ657_06075 [Schumannella soli]